MMIANVKGEFDKLSGTIDFDPANAALTSIEAKIDVNSISTRETDRDNHLKSADFLDVAQFPEIAFKSTKVAADGGGFKVTGNLTIHGVTKEVVLDVESVSDEVKDGWGFMRRGTEAKTRINRHDFDLKFNIPMDGGGVVVGEHVDITLDVEMTRKAD
jgi:polyisoprenoid-binding protein YceI